MKSQIFTDIKIFEIQQHAILLTVIIIFIYEK